ncbi:MAG TPA: maleylpyruvate isomerase N-terminal domain-containing protein [Anaerolineales bacterium]
MPVPDRNFLLHRMDETRSKIEELLPEIDPLKEIYPDWTIRDILAHMTGWDDATIDSLRSHVVERPPSVPAIRSLEEYNAMTVSSRRDLDYEHVLKEWRLTRQVLRTIIKQLPEDKFISPVIVPWGEKATVTYLVDMFRDHEEEHTRDILTCLKHPDKPLMKEGD